MSNASVGRSRVYRTDAIVLRARDFGETDRLLTLFTPHLGKVQAIARGVRRPGSRMGGHLDTFVTASVLLAKGRDLDIVTQAENLRSHASLRDDIWRLSFAQYLADLVDSASPDRLENRVLYDSLILALGQLSEANLPELVVRFFELRLLGVSGYGLQLHRCLRCEAPIQPNGNTFSASLGGILCPSCAQHDPRAPVVSANALKLLRNLQTSPLPPLELRRVPEGVLGEVEGRLAEALAYRLEGQPRSLRYLERLKRDMGPRQI